jgi:hypothetical protein
MGALAELHDNLHDAKIQVDVFHGLLLAKVRTVTAQQISS